MGEIGRGVTKGMRQRYLLYEPLLSVLIIIVGPDSGVIFVRSSGDGATILQDLICQTEHRLAKFFESLDPPFE